MAEIRLATAADVPSLLLLMADFNELEGIPWRPDRVRSALERLLREPALGVVFTACSQQADDLLGYGIATMGYDLEFAGPDAFITELYVRPESRGKAIGRRLVEAVVDYLARRDTGAVHLMVSPGNRRARDLYERCGFHAVPRVMMTRDLGVCHES